MQFTGKVAVVTGGSSGIGRAAVLALAKGGARAAIADMDKESGNRVAEEIRRAGGEAQALPIDVSDEPAVRSLFDAVMARWGRLDILVNNAGIYYKADALNTPREVWDKILAVNLTGAFLCTKYAVPAMTRGSGGVIVNVASEAGLVGIPGQVAYNVSKSGMIELTKSCAVDFASRGIRVNCVCPGTTDTPLVQSALAKSTDPQSLRRSLEQMRPANRLGTPEEIASAILYLASAEAGYATGAILSIDGGYTAQ
jgi:NAD(P)-dependent dehydrogenase (short-subunit alcohol dehydrogenase family)